MIWRIWLLAALVLAMMLGVQWAPAAQDQEKPKGTEERNQPAKAPEAQAGQNEQGSKKRNPFTGNAQAIAEGRTIWMQSGCNGCHGMGGGGMGPSVMDDNWKFGGDDETLFKLIKGEIPASTMPKVWSGLEDEQVWKILAYVRSLYRGDPSKVDW